MLQSKRPLAAIHTPAPWVLPRRPRSQLMEAEKRASEHSATVACMVAIDVLVRVKWEAGKNQRGGASLSKTSKCAKTLTLGIVT